MRCFIVAFRLLEQLRCSVADPTPCKISRPLVFDRFAWIGVALCVACMCRCSMAQTSSCGGNGSSRQRRNWFKENFMSREQDGYMEAGENVDWCVEAKQTWRVKQGASGRIHGRLFQHNFV
jgi:hypothetical protein